jgi:hypothetical protein
MSDQRSVPWSGGRVAERRRGGGGGLQSAVRRGESSAARAVRSVTAPVNNVDHSNSYRPARLEEKQKEKKKKTGHGEISQADSSAVTRSSRKSITRSSAERDARAKWW